ncbi:MAG: SDR family oxidoreductase [Bacteroidota bacterium]
MSKTVFITGSSTGIGRASAIYFQQQGWNVVATMRSPEKETELQQLDNVLVNKLDVMDQASIDSSIQEAVDRFGRIDVLVNNAGYGLMGPFESAPKENVRRQFDVNVFGLFDVTRSILPQMRSQKSGIIINISSIGGRITFPLISLYHSTKWAVEGFSESLHYELAPLGIQVKIVEPGGVQTDFGGRSMDFQHDETLTDYNAFVGTTMANFQTAFDPANMSKPEKIAGVIFEAATDGTPTLRYGAGDDAHQLLGARYSMDDAAFFGMMKSNLQLQ